MMTIRTTIGLLALALLTATAAPAKSEAVSKSFTIKIYSPLAIVLTPVAPSIPCNSPAGAVVAIVTTTGGDGNPVTLTLSGDTTDFGLQGTPPILAPANLVVAAGGTIPTDCSIDPGSIMDSVTVTATQN